MYVKNTIISNMSAFITTYITLRSLNPKGQTARLGQRTVKRGEMYHLPGQFEPPYLDKYLIDFVFIRFNFVCVHVFMQKVNKNTIIYSKFTIKDHLTAMNQISVSDSSLLTVHVKIKITGINCLVCSLYIFLCLLWHDMTRDVI